MSYRRVGEMTPEELLAHLSPTPKHQIELFTAMGGDPADHNYARLSWLTKALRERGVPVKSSRTRGLWLENA
jgi:hypothetical protein